MYNDDFNIKQRKALYLIFKLSLDPEYLILRIVFDFQLYHLTLPRNSGSSLDARQLDFLASVVGEGQGTVLGIAWVADSTASTLSPLAGTLATRFTYQTLPNPYHNTFHLELRRYISSSACGFQPSILQSLSFASILLAITKESKIIYQHISPMRKEPSFISLSPWHLI